MQISQKCQYSLRALFELTKRRGSGPVTVAEIADAQAIPPRFLEVVLQGLRQRGYVKSRRGIHGGYVLAAPLKTLTVGSIIRSVEGPVTPVTCEWGGEGCPLKGQYAFKGMWDRVQAAIEEVYDNTTLQNLIDCEQSTAKWRGPLEYAI